MSHPDIEKPATDLGIKLPRRVSGEFVWKVAVAALLMLNLFMKTQYVSLQDYKDDQKRILMENSNAHSQMQAAIIELKTLVATMEVKNEVNQRQDSELTDHENRIRALENGKKR